MPDILFATASYTLTSSAKALLDSLAGKLVSAAPDSVVVEGHTDSRGVRQANIELSFNRANAVRTYLQERLPKEITAWTHRGWAESRSVASNDFPDGRQRNRRVEIYLYRKE